MEPADLIRAELRKGRSHVTPGGLKYWPALDAFNVILAEQETLREAVHEALTDDPTKLAGAIEHSESCARWVELDDVSADLHPFGTCDCGLDALRAALSVPDREQP